MVRNAPVGPNLFHLRLHAPHVAVHARPGQFVHLLYRDAYGPFLRRPFSVFMTDPAAGTFDVLYLVRGPFTHGMAQIAEGGAVSLVGPLGNSFSARLGEGRRHILVAGGVGAPPLYFLARELVARDGAEGVIVINGARSVDLLVAQAEFAALGADARVTTDDGSAGRKGTVLDELRTLALDIETCTVYACGPDPMLRAVGTFCNERGIECQVSMETMMPCGVGVCMGCAVKLRAGDGDGYRYVRACREGPVFAAGDVLWD